MYIMIVSSISYGLAMHENREIYSLKQYQQILIDRWRRTVYWFAKKEDDRYDMYFAKPTPKTQWLSGKPRKKYYRKLYTKLNTQLRTDKFHYSFCTLTYHTRKYSQKYAFLMLKDQLKEFIRLVRKKYPKIQYYWVIELTKRLYPHIHIVFNGYVHWLVIRAIWYRVTSSYITDIRSIPSHDISKYIAGYLAKQSKHDKTQWSTIFKNIDRLYGSSRDFFTTKIVNPDIGEWFLISLSCDCFLPDWKLYREDREMDFWLIPHHYAASLLLTHDIDHINWQDSYPDIYASFLNAYSRKDLYDIASLFRYATESLNPESVIPF